MDGKRHSCCTTELLEENNPWATQDYRRSRQQSGKPKAIPGKPPFNDREPQPDLVRPRMPRHLDTDNRSGHARPARVRFYTGVANALLPQQNPATGQTQSSGFRLADIEPTLCTARRWRLRT
jgi:hypothetical protein